MFQRNYKNLTFTDFLPMPVKIAFRDAYANIIKANNPDDMDWARIQYLQHKRQLGVVDVCY